MNEWSSLSDGAIESILGLRPAAPTPPAPSRVFMQNCIACGLSLALPAPCIEQAIEIKRCQGCKRSYFTASPCAERAATAMVAEAIDRDIAAIAPPPDAEITNDLLARLVGKSRESLERREHVRFRIDREVLCIPLDKKGRPVYEAMNALMIDMSDTGAGLHVSTYWSWPLVAIDCSAIDQPGQQLVGRVSWRHHEVAGTRFGCEFIDLDAV